MFFRSRQKYKETSIVKSPSVEHIKFVLQSVVNALNTYIYSSNYYLFSNKSKVIDPASTRGKDINSIAKCVYACLYGNDHAEELIHQFFAKLHLHQKEKVELPQIDIPQSINTENLIVAFIKAMESINCYDWSVGLTGNSCLRDAVYEAIATYFESEYMDYLQDELKINQSLARHEQTFIHLGEKYSCFFNYNTSNASLHESATDECLQKPNYHELDKVRKYDFVKNAVRVLFYCVDGDDHKDEINEKGILRRALQSRDLDKKELTISYDRKKYGVLIGDDADQLVSEIPLKNKDVKYYLFKFNLKEPAFWQHKADLKYHDIYKHLVSYDVVFMINKEKLRKQKNQVYYNISEKYFDVSCAEMRDYERESQSERITLS